MYIKIALLIIVLLQLTVFVVSCIQSKRQHTKYLQALNVRFLWGIAICINMLCLVPLTGALKYDLGADERIENQYTIAAILILILLEIAHILFRYIKQRKWMGYLCYFIDISIVSVLVIRFLIKDHTLIRSFVIVLFEVNVVPIVADVIAIFTLKEKDKVFGGVELKKKFIIFLFVFSTMFVNSFSGMAAVKESTYKKPYSFRKMTRLKVGNKTLKVSSKKNAMILKIYQKGKTLKTEKISFMKYVKKYKNLRIIQINKYSAGKIRVLYANEDANSSTGSSGGSVIVDYRKKKTKQEAVYNFWPTAMDDGYVYSAVGGFIQVAKQKTGKRVSLYSKPETDMVAGYEAYSCKSGYFLYVNTKGAFLAKIGDEKFSKVVDFSKSRYREKYVKNALLLSNKSFVIGFASDESCDADTFVKYSI